MRIYVLRTLPNYSHANKDLELALNSLLVSFLDKNTILECKKGTASFIGKRNFDGSWNVLELPFVRRLDLIESTDHWNRGGGIHWLTNMEYRYTIPFSNFLLKLKQ